MAKKNQRIEETTSGSSAPAMDLGIKEKDRKAIAEGLRAVLADTYTLYLKTHGYHWNVTGPMFRTLHLMFEEQYNELWAAVDVIAERIRSLGYPAPGTYKELSSLTEIEDGEGIPDATEMIRQLISGHETVVRTVRSLYPAVERASDEATADVLTERLSIHEKTAWMLRSLLQ